MQHGVTSTVSRSTCALYRLLAVICSVTAKWTLINRAVWVAIKWHAVVLKLIDYFWCFTAHKLNHVLIAQPIRAFDGVVKMVVPVVLTHIAKRGADAALRSNRMRTCWKYFGKNCYIEAGFGQLQ